MGWLIQWLIQVWLALCTIEPIRDQSGCGMEQRGSRKSPDMKTLIAFVLCLICGTLEAAFLPPYQPTQLTTNVAKASASNSVFCVTNAVTGMGEWRQRGDVFTQSNNVFTGTSNVFSRDIIAPNVQKLGSGPSLLRRQPRRHTIPYLKLIPTSTAGWSSFQGSVSATNFDSAGSTNHTLLRLDSNLGGLSESSATWDFTSTNLIFGGRQEPHVMFRLFFPDVSSVSNYVSSVILVADTAYANFGIFKFAESASLQVGWNTFVITPSMWTVTGTMPWQSASHIRITFSAVTNGISFVFGEFSLYERLAKAKLAITFDDGLAVLAQGADLLTSNGLTATFYVTQPGGGKLTVPQWTAMRDSGHLIANHSWSHLQPSTGSTLAQVLDDARIMADYLRTNGFSEGSLLYAIPGGSSQIFSDTTTFEDYLKYVSQVRATTRVPALFGYPSMPWRGDILHTSSSDDTNLAALSVTRAISDGAISITLWHEATVTNSQFSGWIDWIMPYVRSNLIDVVTVNELLDLEDTEDFTVHRGTIKQSLGISTNLPQAALHVVGNGSTPLSTFGITAGMNTFQIETNCVIWPTNQITTPPTLTLGSFGFWNSNGLALWKVWNTNGTTAAMLLP